MLSEKFILKGIVFLVIKCSAEHKRPSRVLKMTYVLVLMVTQVLNWLSSNPRQ